MSKLRILVGVGLFLLLASSAMAKQYNVIDLGTLDGKYTRVTPWAINEEGRVVGDGSWDDEFGKSHSRGFIWDSTNGMRELPSFGGDYTYAQDINDLDQVIGRSSYPGGRPENACIWISGTISDLGTGWATGINNLGQVVGGTGSGVAFIWDAVEGRRNFGDGDTRPSAINDHGQVTGNSYGASSFGQAFIWDKATGIMQYLDLIAGYQGSRGEAINVWGQLAGHAWTDTWLHEHRPFMWDSGVMRYLGGAQGSAWDINDNGEVVGEVNELYGSQMHGFIWDIRNGMQDLNNLVIPGHGFALIGSATGINNSGQIVAYARTDASTWHAVLLDPITSLEVTIDIKPGVFPNTIIWGSKGTVQVAILTTPDFDALTVDPVTVTFDGTTVATRSKLIDVDSDGVKDLLLYFTTQALGLVKESTEATLTGTTYDGVEITGTDSVKIVTKGKK